MVRRILWNVVSLTFCKIFFSHIFSSRDLSKPSMIYKMYIWSVSLVEYIISHLAKDTSLVVYIISYLAKYTRPRPLVNALWQQLYNCVDRLKKIYKYILITSPNTRARDLS